MTTYYDPQKEQQKKLIQKIDEGFKYLLMNPNLDSKFRPEVKKVYEMYQKLVIWLKLTSNKKIYRSH